MLHLRKPQTAIREGFQSVIDYWPESREAVLAAYCIADAYKTMGEVAPATRAFRNVINDHPDHPIAVRAKVNLLHYARLHEDHDARLALLNDLTYKTERTEATRNACIDAAHELARVHFHAQRLEEGRKALATTYKGRKLFDTVYKYSVDTVGHLLKDPKKQSAALKLGEQLLAALRAQSVSDPERAREMLYRAASLHWKLGRPSDTWRLYEEVGERWGKDDGLLGKMAEWFKARDQRDEARKVYLRFENQVSGLQQVAAMDLEEGKYKEAMEVFRKLLELDGDHAGDYLWSIADCWEHLSDWKKAIATYRQIDRFPETYFAMAKCHRRIAEYKEAIVLYNQAKVIDKSAPEASLQIGFTYEEAAEKRNAIRTFQLTCKRYPKSGQAARAHAHLQKKYNINVTLGGAEEE
ncbi:MAG: tetratricopeptide repeat protein [Akkermansiaceae bacterium]|nr:tetratricopeptide repeat protein [Akkermansiaceae bacterium]